MLLTAALLAVPALGQPAPPDATLPAGALADGGYSADVEAPFEPLLDVEGVALDWPDMEGLNGSEAEAPAGDVRYTLKIEGLSELGLEDDFRSLSTLWAQRGQPANLAQLRRRMSDDQQLIDQMLRSLGYYGGRIDLELTGGAAAKEVLVKVEPGPLYRFERVRLVPPEGSTSPAPPDLAQSLIGIDVGDPIVAAQVTALEDLLAGKLADAGYPFPEVRPPAIGIDHATRLGTLDQIVDAGPRGRFGRTRIEGDTQGFTERHMGVLARYRTGDLYTGALREDLRQALIQTGLFGAVSLKPVPAGPPGPDGTQDVDMVATVEKAPVRTIAGGAGFNTGQGARLEASWTHRNLFPPEGALITRLIAAQREQLLSGEFRRRNFKTRDQTLSVLAGVSRERQFGFEAETVQLTAGIVRESNLIWQKPITFSLAVQALATKQLDRSVRMAGVDPRATFFILALPGSVTLDRSDDLLNPSKGFRLTGRVSPEFTLRQGRNFNYVKLQVDGSYYQPVGANFVMAGRLHMGSIAGADRGRVAPTRRFYAGGGGSVRGFAFQGVGPNDFEGRPTGGNSLTEVNIEGRYRFTALGNDLGLAAFVDAGQVYPGTLPSFDSLRVGAGVGVRYYTAFGPVRIDVATPVTRQPRDPRVAFYVSIGQAF